MGIEASLCVALALNGVACEKSLEALDKQYGLLAPARKLERELRVGFDQVVGRKAADTLTIFIGAGMDWRFNQKFYIEIGGTF